MNEQAATAQALRTGLRAAQHGLNLANKGDPDVGELVTACRHADVPIQLVFLDH